VFFWFAGLSFVAVALIFGSPLIDYRLVMAGAVLPVTELLWGPPWLMHTLLFPVVVMTVVMVAFRGKRLTQRRWIGLAIGAFLHLVLDGSWARTSLFWWPGFGTEVAEADVPSLPGAVPLVLMEVVGIAALVWAGRRYGLDDDKRRERFIRTGHLDRTMIGEAPGTC